MISIIVLTCDSQISKNFCLRHCLFSIINQDYINYEVVIVDNSSGVNIDAQKLIEYLNKRFPHIKMRFISMGTTVPRGVARNSGARSASGDLLIFMDEDVILVDNSTLTTIYQFSQANLWGCGATRLWTIDNWFNMHSEQILEDITLGQYDSLLNNSGNPEQFIRGSDDIKIETRSMIGHFGYCRKAAFNVVMGFEDAGEADSFDDDILNVKLFQRYGFPKLFPELKIIHVNHPIHGSRSSDFTYYFEYLVDKGLFDFDSENLIFGLSNTDISTPLEPIHYNSKVSGAYRRYLAGLPLNHKEMNEDQLSFWKENIRLELDDYCRAIASLLSCESVESYVLNNYTDYDNLAPILDSLISTGMLEISDAGSLTDAFSFDHRYRKANVIENFRHVFTPNSDYNQFPCDSVSVGRRVNLFRNRYPYCEFLRLAIIGDDDFFADSLISDIWIQPIIIEKDPKILNHYLENRKIKCIQLDLLDINSDEFEFTIKSIQKVHTFITDPPYTVHGALSFLYSGLKLMEFDGHQKEFYLVMNPSIIGKSFAEMLRLLAIARIVVKDIIHAFNNYPFPNDYNETERANNFNAKNKIGGSSYSSTSNLYVLETSNPDIQILKEYIASELFYNHYKL